MDNKKSSVSAPASASSRRGQSARWGVERARPNRCCARRVCAPQSPAVVWSNSAAKSRVGSPSPSGRETRSNDLLRASGSSSACTTACTVEAGALG